MYNLVGNVNKAMDYRAGRDEKPRFAFSHVEAFGSPKNVNKLKP